MLLAKEMVLLPETRYSLIARLARPEDSATWHEFQQTYEEAIVRYCRTRGLQDADAVEVAQDVLMAVHSVASTWQPSERTGSFRAWLFETARRCCVRLLRKRVAGNLSEIESAELTDGSSDVLDRLTAKETHDYQQWAFCAAASVVQLEVEDTTWQAFWLTAVQNVPAGEVAKRLGLSIGNVYTAKCRVLGRIRSRVAELSIADVQGAASPTADKTEGRVL